MAKSWWCVILRIRGFSLVLPSCITTAQRQANLTSTFQSRSTGSVQQAVQLSLQRGPDQRHVRQHYVAQSEGVQRPCIPVAHGTQGVMLHGEDLIF